MLKFYFLLYENDKISILNNLLDLDLKDVIVVKSYSVDSILNKCFLKSSLGEYVDYCIKNNMNNEVNYIKNYFKF